MSPRVDDQKAAGKLDGPVALLFDSDKPFFGLLTTRVLPIASPYKRCYL
jgi:hypothetical protein